MGRASTPPTLRLDLWAQALRASKQNRGIEVVAPRGISKPLVPDVLWHRIQLLLPEEPPKPKGGDPAFRIAPA